jgi:hypothetical protein
MANNDGYAVIVAEDLVFSQKTVINGGFLAYKLTIKPYD